MNANVDAVRRGRVDSVLPMIAKKAISTYNKLPLSERIGTSVEDLIAEGTTFAVMKASKMWNPKKMTKFSTYLFAALDNYYKNVLRDAYTDKRVAHVLSADTTVVRTSNGNELLLIDHLKRSKKDRVEDAIISRIDAERGFIRAYALSSTLLRKYLIQWILQPKTSKIKDGIDARAAAEEFRVCIAPILTIELCLTVQRDFECRSRIANTLMSKFVTPSGNHKIAFKMSQTVERRLLPILSEERRKACVALV